jgi:hypothetical protein
VRFSEIANRLTGVSTPIFGVSWTPPVLDVDVARDLLTYLEDRRVLFDPPMVEIPEWCVESVLETRSFLTEKLGQGGVAEELADVLRAMRASCRRFLATVSPGRERGVLVPERLQLDREATPADMIGGGWIDWTFNQALGELRGAFGIHVAQLAVRYGLDVREPLAAILPLEPEDEQNDEARPALP